MYRIHVTCISTTFKLLYCSCCEYIISYESTLGISNQISWKRGYEWAWPKKGPERCEILGGGCADPFGMCYQGESLLGGSSPGGWGVKLGWERGEKILVGECRRGCGGLDCWTEDRKCSFELKLGATHLETGQLCYLSISANILRCLVLWEYSWLIKIKMLTVMIRKRCRWW